MDTELIRTLSYFAGIILVVIAGVYGTSINQLMGIRLQRPRFLLKDKSEIPAYLVTVFDEAVAQLTELGFEYHHTQLSYDLISHDHAEKFTVVMVNRQTRVFADISPASSFVDLPGYEIDFWSIASNAKVLITMNGRGHTLLCGVPNAEILDPMTPTISDTYQAHLSEHTEVFGDKPLVTVNAQSYVKLQQKIMDGYFLSLLNEGGLVSTGHNLFRLTFKKARVLTRQILHGNKRRKKLLHEKMLAQKQREKNAGDSPVTPNSINEVSAEAEVHAYQRLLSAQKRTPGGTAGKILIFALTLALSYVAFGLVFSFSSVFILLGVILFHELGHIAAMYIFKYRDLQILFIPLLGAAATGNKSEVAIWKQVVVYLMGPLPGIVLGIALIAFYQQAQIPWVYETAVTMLLINYLNLLPFVPLDGGHVIRLTIMERFPTGKLIFSGFSAIAFAAGAWYINEPVFWVLAIAMLFSLPWSALEAGVLNELFQQPSQFDQLNKDQKLLKIFETLKQPKFKKLQYAQKFKLVKTISEVVLHSNHLSRLGSLGLNGLYISALLLTPPAVLVSMVGIDNATNFVAMIRGEMPKQDWDAEIAKQTSPDKRFDLMLQAAQFYTVSKDYKKAQNYLEEAEKAFSLINTDSALAKLYHAYAIFYQRKDDNTQAETYIGKVINLYRQLPELNAYSLATTYQTLALLHRQMQKEQDYETDLKTGLSYALKGRKPEQRYVISALISQILDLYNEKKTPDKALSLLQDTLPVLLDYTDVSSNEVTSYVYQELGWLYITMGNTAQATEQFEHALALVTAQDVQNNTTEPETLEMANIHLALAMAHFKSGNFSIAQDQMAAADKIAKQNQFASLGQYLQGIREDVNDPDQLTSRNMQHWSMITAAVNKLAPNLLSVTTTQNTGTVAQSEATQSPAPVSATTPSDTPAETPAPSNTGGQ